MKSDFWRQMKRNQRFSSSWILEGMALIAVLSVMEVSMDVFVVLKRVFVSIDRFLDHHESQDDDELEETIGHMI